MRARQEINKEFSDSLDMYSQKLLLEVLLDVRDLLMKDLKITDKSTELEIYYFIRANDIPIDYKPYRDKKEDIISKLKGLKIL